MKLLAEHGKHDPEDERWNAYGQFTYIYGFKQAFAAPYTNLDGSTNSLLPTSEQSFTGSATAYLGARLWQGSELYFVPELISERPLSNLKGLGGAVQDFELQKGGAETPTLYVSRVYLKQTFRFGGDQEKEESGPLQLGTTKEDSRRLVLVVGNFSILDFFDKNAFSIDPRQGLFNLAFLTYAAYDFASNARGYSYGAVSELYWDRWAVRYGRMTPPLHPNQLQTDYRLAKYYGDQIEIEHKHEAHGGGTLRVLGYRNREAIGRFQDAINAFKANPEENATTCQGFNYGSNNPSAPDLCWARKSNIKEGIGAFGEQYLLRDVGVFGRGMASDGKTEVDAYTSTDRSASLGVLAKGSTWSRPNDVAGGGYNWGWISHPHATYLGMGGIDGFVGDGRIRPGAEQALDAFYSVNLHKSLWLAGDYQRVINPGFNVDRGPVDILSVKIHGEF